MHFSSLLKGFQWSKKNKFFLEGESPTLTTSADQEVAKWISLDWSSLRKRVIKWDSFNKTDFFNWKTTSVKAVNKSSNLKLIGQHFLSKI